jgi:dolichol-phosphate mannosyltransferase
MKISIVTPCFNEVENVNEFYDRVVSAISPLQNYSFEIIFIDNASTDNTVALLKEIASRDSRVKIIVNIRNFGHLRSPYWGVMQSSGDATICLASDLQDPPEMIPSFISEWEKGWKVVMAVKPESKANPFVHFLRKLYYRFLDGISEVPLVKDATGFGLYDRAVLNCVRDIHDPYPYFRGLICELGFPIKTIAFNQPRRSRGISKNNFYTLFDLAMLGIVSHSIVPIRLATMMGFFVGTLSLIVGIYYGVMKIIFWDTFPIGIAPLVIGFFFMTSTLLLFLGLMGEYIASIHTYVKNRPIVVEKERINF